MRRGDSLEDDTAIGTLDIVESLYPGLRNRDEHGRYKQLKSHLTNQDWQTIPDKGIKKMLLGCITGAARQEIVLV